MLKEITVNIEFENSRKLKELLQKATYHSEQLSNVLKEIESFKLETTTNV